MELGAGVGDELGQVAQALAVGEPEDRSLEGDRPVGALTPEGGAPRLLGA